MAQLRDAHTSEILAEGTPLTVALIGKKLGFDEVLFDGVGKAFDPELVIKEHEERLASLKAADATKEFAAEKKAANVSTTEAHQALKEARARVEG